jgi:hypothetical protein
MKEEIVYLWRIQWAGKWRMTHYYCTEEHIRKEHPEAVVVSNSRQVRMVAETPVERMEAMSRGSARKTL